MAKGGARPGAGRPRGPTKAKIERLEMERIQEQLKADGIEVVKAQRANTKLAKEVIEDFMNLFAGIATTCQPYPPNHPQNPNFNEERFEKYARMTVEAARELAKYQSPQFRAIVVAPAPPSKADGTKRFTFSIFEGSGRPAIPITTNGSDPQTQH